MPTPRRATHSTPSRSRAPTRASPNARCRRARDRRSPASSGSCRTIAEVDLRSDDTATSTAGVPATFLFADIAGFTALTEAHGDEEAAALVADFCAAVRAELPSFGGTHVKSIGD